MSSLPPVQIQDGQYLNETWKNVAPYVTPPLAASIAICPVFYLLMVKSAQQVQEPIPKFNWSAVKTGFRAAPTIGMTIGIQMFAQERIEKIVMNITGNQDAKGMTSMMISSAMVGLISAPTLAIFNGQTIKGRTSIESLKQLTAKQVIAIVTRETSFLLALRISDPASEAMQSITGDNLLSKYGSIFMTGVVSSMIGHPADTVLTLWQKNMPVISCRQLMRGSITKAVAVGGFSILYNAISNTLTPK